MLKVQRKLNATTIVEADGQTAAEVFEKISWLEEIFRVSRCGRCGCERITFTSRRDKEDHAYYQAQCLDEKCGAEFRFGIRKKGGVLFPQLKFPERHPQAGQWKPDGGWLIWNEHGEDEREQYQPAAPQRPASPPQAQQPQTFRPSQQPAKGPYPPPWDKNRQQ